MKRSQALAWFASCTAVAHAGSAAQAQEAGTVQVGVIPAITMSPIYIAAGKGYFRDAGVDVQFVHFASATDMTAPLGQGRLDVGAGALSAGFYNSVARGIDVRIVASLGTTAPHYGFEILCVRNALVQSGRYKGPRDLKGLRIAVNTLGASSTPALNALLKKNGMTLDDVVQVQIPFPQTPPAIANGSIDAALVAEPTATLMQKDGVATKVLDEDAWYPNQQIAALLYGSQLLHQRRDDGLKFMLAYLRGVRTYNDALAGGHLAGPAADDVIRILTQLSTIKDPAVYRAVTPNGVDPNGRLELPSMRSDLAFYRSLHQIEGQVEVEQAIDNGFLADAIKQLGPYKPAQ